MSYIIPLGVFVLERFRKLCRIVRQFYPGFVKMLNAAAAERNKEPILTVLRGSVNTGRPLQALEISSGTGQHVTHFAQALHNIIWQPSEYDHQSLARYHFLQSYFSGYAAFNLG